MRSKELSVELRDRIVSRHRSGEGYLAKLSNRERRALVREVTKNPMVTLVVLLEDFPMSSITSGRNLAPSLP